MDDEFKFILFHKHYCIVIKILLKFVSNKQCVIIGSDNGLTQIIHQAIIWNNVDLVHWRLCASLGLDGLTFGAVIYREFLGDNA